MAKEQAQHARDAPAKFAALYDALTTTLPAHDRVLIGRDAILAYLQQLAVHRPNGGPLTWRMILRWRIAAAFPVLPGRHLVHRAYASSPVSTTHAVTAWLLTRLASTDDSMFTIRAPSIPHTPLPTEESAPEFGTADSAVPRRSSAA